MSNIIWTNHARERNQQRQITEDWIETTVNRPDNYSEVEGGRIKSQKSFGQYTVTVITTKADSGKYLILSSWVNPPISGTMDHKNKSFQKNMKKSSGAKKIIRTILGQLGF